MLNSTVPGLSKSGVNQLWTYLLQSNINITINFFPGSFSELMHASACPLPWWLYENDTVWLFDGYQGTCRSLGISLDSKFEPASDTSYLGNQHSFKLYFMFLLGYQCWTLQPTLSLGTCCDNLEYKDNVCC